ncbi:recombinase family protein [Amnibacterium kyonggiense]
MSSKMSPALSGLVTIKKAAIYARISETARDRDKVADQIAQCRRLAERRGYAVDDGAVFQDDGITGLGSKRRPGWEALLDAIVAGRVDVVLATEEERFARNVSDKADLQAACIDSGAVWETERDGFVDPSSESGEFFSTMRAAMGRMESRRKAARQKARNAEASAEGVPVPGRRRYGYESDARTPRADEAVQVRRMFEHVAAGGSLRAIVRALREEGVDPSPGKAWTPRRVRDTLLNPHYAGIIRHRGAEIASSVVTPIVDAELAAQVRALLADPSRRTASGTQPRYLSSGLAVCGVCGERLHFSGRAYRCTAGNNHPSVRPDLLDDTIRREVARAFLVGGGDLFPRQAGGIDVVARLAEHARNLAEVDAVMSDRAEGLVPPDVARAHLRRLQGERDLIEADLERARAERGASGALALLAESLLGADTLTMPEWVATEAAVIARFDGLDLDARRELVRSLLAVQVDRGRSPDRIRVQHLRAVRLNDHEEDYDAA